MKSRIINTLILLLSTVLHGFAAESTLSTENLNVFGKTKLGGPVEVGTIAITNNMVLYYSFDSDSGTNVTDSSGMGNHGYKTSAFANETGLIGQAARFTSSSTYIVVPSASLNMNGWTGFSVSVWAYPYSPLNNYSFVLARGMITNSTNGGFTFWTPGYGGYEGSAFSVLTNAATGDMAKLMNMPRSLLNTWTHYVCTCTPTGMSYYINGALVAQQPLSLAQLLDVSGSKMTIGTIAISPLNTWPDMFFRGKVDELRIYNRELTEDEVTALYYANPASNAPSFKIGNVQLNLNGVNQSGSTGTNIFMGQIGVGTATPGASLMMDVAGNARVLGTNTVLALSIAGQTRTNWPAGAETWAQYPASADVNAGNRTVTVGNLIVNNTATFNNSISLVGTSRTDITSGMVLYYNFASNTVPVPDLSGSGHVGSVSGATWTVSGKTNGAYSFDATNDWIQTASTAALSPTNALTILAWIKLDTTNKYHMIVTKNPSSGAATSQPGNYEFRVNNNGVLYFQSQYTTNASQSASGVKRVDDLGWHFVGVTVDAASRGIRLYRDGVLDNTVTVANRPIAFTNAEPVRIGRRKDGYYYDGLIDEVRIYNRKLSSEEISQIYGYYQQDKNVAVLTADKFSQTGYLQTNVFMGNVGIGTNTATNALSVAGTASATFFVGNGSMLTSLAGGNIANASIAGSKLANLTVTSNQIANSTITTGKLHLASVDARYVNATGDTMNGVLQLPADGLRVNSNQLIVVGGKVGVGTNNPAEKLHVYGNLRVDGTISGNGAGMTNIPPEAIVGGVGGGSVPEGTMTTTVYVRGMGWENPNPVDRAAYADQAATAEVVGWTLHAEEAATAAFGSVLEQEVAKGTSAWELLQQILNGSGSSDLSMGIFTQGE